MRLWVSIYFFFNILSFWPDWSQREKAVNGIWIACPSEPLQTHLQVLTVTLEVWNCNVMEQTRSSRKQRSLERWKTLWLISVWEDRWDQWSRAPGHASQVVPVFVAMIWHHTHTKQRYEATELRRCYSNLLGGSTMWPSLKSTISHLDTNKKADNEY